MTTQKMDRCPECGGEKEACRSMCFDCRVANVPDVRDALVTDSAGGGPEGRYSEGDDGFAPEGVGGDQW